MRRILLIGNSPLPDENVQSRPAAGLRTWQFLKALERTGCIIKMALIDMMKCHGEILKQVQDDQQSRGAAEAPTDYPQPQTQPEQPLDSTDAVQPTPESAVPDSMVRQTHHDNEPHHSRIAKDGSALLPKLQKICDEFEPEAIVSVNTFPSFMAAQLKTRAPLWCDLNGWILAEAQAQAFKMNSNDYLAHYLDMEKTILRRADKISCVSQAQSLAVLGELGLLGRLNNESFGYEFAHHVANGIEMFEGESPADSGEIEGLDFFAGQKNLPHNAFVLLWMGGYNTWVDEATLYKGVAAAMEKCERLYFVSTGGAIDGLDNRTFARFKEMVGQSEYRERFVFLGWIPTAEIPHVYARADAGLNVDRRCAETLTGARNRINEMMKFGVPVITTLGSEISYEVVKAGAGIGVHSGRHEELTAAIVKMYSHNFGYGEHGKKYIAEKCRYEIVCAPLIEWLKNPRPAPDRGVRVNAAVGGLARSALRYLREHGLRKTLRKVRQRIVK